LFDCAQPLLETYAFVFIVQSASSPSCYTATAAAVGQPAVPASYQYDEALGQSAAIWLAGHGHLLYVISVGRCRSVLSCTVTKAADIRRV